MTETLLLGAWEFDFVPALIVLGAYLLLQGVILPRLGFST